MTIRLGANIAALRGQRQLRTTSKELATVFERLSSGQRINRAADDAAGLAIADSLNAASRVFNQGVRNLNDGLSLLAIADAAVGNLSGILTRLRELAEQAANGVYSNKQRAALDAEAQALSAEFSRVSRSAEFNGRRLFTGEFERVELQAGFGKDAVLTADIGGRLGDGKFGSSTMFTLSPAGDFMRAVALGDLNGDGHADMLAAGNHAGLIVKLGKGDGSFGSSMTYGSSGGVEVILEDFNGDGFLDAAAVNGSLAQVLVYLGRGDGSFGAAATFASDGTDAYGIAAGDINGDGIMDLISAGYNASTGHVAVLLGAGDGTFGASVSYTMDSGISRAVQLGDLNGDGYLDIVSAGFADAPSGSAAVRLGTGSGEFGAVQIYTMDGTSSSALTLTDFNNDGVLDIATAGRAGGDGYSTVRLGAGNGTFGAAVSYQSEGFRSLDLTHGDFNGDGFVDLITAGYDDATDGYITVRLGAGNGTFSGATSYIGGTKAFGVAVGDMNEDGVLDVISVGSIVTNAGYAQTRIGGARAGVAPILPFSLKTMAAARQALPQLARRQELLITQRGEIGAFQSRAEVARSLLEVAGENFKAAEGRIRDSDIADESSRLTRLNILQNAASSVLAQANLQPSLAIKLL